MAISESLKADIIERLLRDLTATVGGDRRSEILEFVDLALTFITEPEHFTEWVVERAQQVLHDTFEDTTWPRCPRHGRHPLWLRWNNGDPTWCCDTDNTPVARLGELAVSRQQA